MSDDPGHDAEPFQAWRRWSLATQFALAGGAVMAAAAAGVGLWVSERIEENVVRNTANATALYMESFIAPLSQELVVDDALSKEARASLSALFDGTPLGERVISYKIWKKGGLVAEASDRALVGRTFEPSQNLRRAWDGVVQAHFEGLHGEENTGERALGLPLLEIYSPIREALSGRIFAVAEFYEVNEQLASDLAVARRNTWVAVTAVMLAIGGSLYLIVRRGSVTIDRAREALAQRVGQLAEMSESNRALRLRVQEAAARSSTLNEKAMRRIGAELHDGPAQHLAFAALRLDALRDATARTSAREDVEAVSQALSEAMHEIRAISRGLAAPDIEARAAGEIIATAVQAHAARTRRAAKLDIDVDDAPDLSAAAKLCIYRFVQEGLNNAARHAESRGVAVRARIEQGAFVLTVSDRGPGFGGDWSAGDGVSRLGLPGLRDRVESIGGAFEVFDRPDGGAAIRMALKLGES